MKFVVYCIVLICVPLLILTSWRAKHEIDYLREKERISRSEISALIIRVDLLEEELFLSGKERK